jgi:glycerol-3-phosphate acyltransferase PlsY
MKIIIILLCYLIGSIPFGYIAGRLFKGIDIRSVGSGNIGATNVGRILGIRGFISVFLLDLLKGFIPVIIIKNYYPRDIFLLLVALFIIIGHMYTIFLKFKGGKGVATTIGVFLALEPAGTFVALIVFLLTALVSKFVSLSSILAAISLAIYIWFVSNWLSLQIIATIVVIFIIYKHKENIKRIINGTENKIGVRVDKP